MALIPSYYRFAIISSDQHKERSPAGTTLGSTLFLGYVTVEGTALSAVASLPMGPDLDYTPGKSGIGEAGCRTSLGSED